MAQVNNIAHEIVEIGKILYQRGLIAGSEGNISARLDDNRILVTPSGLCKGRVTSDDLVLVDSEGCQHGGAKSASSELPMHLHVYRKRPDIRACIHSHAPYATSFAVAGMGLPCDVLPEAALFLGPVPLTEYAPPGTESVGNSLDPFLGEGEVFLLKSHGLLTIGTDLEEALRRHEMVEQYARIVHLAKQLGNVDTIPASDLERLEQLRGQHKKPKAG